MNLKSVVLLVSTLFIYKVGSAQVVNYAYDSEEIKGVQAGPLYVIPTGVKSFDDSLQMAIQTYWKVGPIKIISKGELEKYLGDKSNYFIGPLTDLSNQTNGLIESPTLDDFVRNIYIFHGGSHNKKLQMGGQYPIASCTLPFYARALSTNQLGFVVKAINDYVQLVITKQIDPIVHASGTYKPVFCEEFSKKANILKDKTLLLDKNSNYYLKEKVLATYNFKYQVLTAEEIIALLKTDPKKYCYLSDAIIASGLIRIFDGETKELIYASPSGMGVKVNEKQIAALNAAVLKK